MSKDKEKLFLIDAMAMIYKSYFAMISNPLINSKGKIDKKLKLTVKNLKQTMKKSTTKKDNTLLIVGICIVFILGGIFYVKKIKK